MGFQFQLEQIGWTLNRIQGKYNEFTLKLTHGSFLLPIEEIGGDLEPTSQSGVNEIPIDWICSILEIK